jgi:hypothetical protein
LVIAQRCLAADVKTKVVAMLAADPNNLTKHDIASEATWAECVSGSPLAQPQRRRYLIFNIL